MREAPLTDSQKTDKDLDGSYPSRVGTREVTARLKDGSWTKRGRGGAAMNSTATELEFTRRRAMRGIVKGFVIGVLGLAGLLVPVGYVHAVPKSCNGGRYIVCGDGTCGRRSCSCNGKTLTPGADCTKTDGKIYYCDGCSGKMKPIGLRTPQPILPQLQLTPSVPPSQVKPPAGGTLQK
jgi:hypothetical protein